MNTDIVLREQMGERIRKIRNEMKMTKQALAKRMGVTGQFLGVVECGRSTISYEKLKRLCDISGYSADYILFGKNVNILSETKEILNKYTDEEIAEICESIKKMTYIIKNKNN